MNSIHSYNLPELHKVPSGPGRALFPVLKRPGCEADHHLVPRSGTVEPLSTPTCLHGVMFN
jgi:hypothetical protein